MPQKSVIPIRLIELMEFADLAARYHEAIKKREQYVNYIFKGRFSLDFV